MTTKFDRLSTHIPSAYKPRVNRWIKGILESWGAGDDAIAQAIAETKAQLFVTTASQEYLDRLGSNVGVERPSSLGMGDLDFRDLVPALSFAPKQIRAVINQLLEIWYRPEAVFANMVSTAYEPYNLTDGDNLKLIVDRSTQVEVTFKAADFANISAATAIEVSNSINKQAISMPIRASEFNNSVVGRRFIRLRSTTPGPSGEIQVWGGTAQNILKFPSVRATTQAMGTQWEVTLVTGDTIRMEYTGVGQSPNLSALQDGDIMVVSGPFDPLNQGSFEIQDIGVNATVDGVTPGKKYTGNYVEIKNSQAAMEVVTQADDLDVAFYFPKRHDVNTYPRPAVLYETNHKELVVILPASSTVISRDERGSAHIHPNANLKIITIDNSSGISFEQGDEIVGMSTVFLNTGSGDFEEGELLTAMPSGATATVFKIISNEDANVILGVINVTGAFSVGDTVTGGSSGATGSFLKTITTTSAMGVLDSTLAPDRKFGIQDIQGAFIEGEGILGRTEMRLEYANNNFELDELITTATTMNLIPPYLGEFTLGETVRGATSSAEATVADIVRHRIHDKSTLQVGVTIPGFVDGEIITGLTSGAFGTLDSLLIASGATARFKELGTFRDENIINVLRQQTGVFQSGEIVIGSSSGSKGVVGEVFSSVGVFESMDTEQEFLSPYVFDEAADFTASFAAGALTEPIEAGETQSIIETTDLPEAFPNSPGYFILDYGTSDEEGPIRYIGKPTENSILADPAFIYQKDHPTGSNIRYVNSPLEPTDVRVDGYDYAAFVTGLAEARIVLQALIREVVATGVTVRFIVVFPEYAFECYNTNEAV